MPDARVLTDAQSAEILYKNAGLRSVPDSMSTFFDFEAIFGRASLQCAFRYTYQHRQSEHRGDRRAQFVAALRLPARIRWACHCPSGVACHGGGAMVDTVGVLTM